MVLNAWSRKMNNKKAQALNPQIILVIAGILLGYVLGSQIGIGQTLGALLGGVAGFALSRYL